MLKFIKSFFGKKPEAAPEVPYKVETPAVSPIAEQATEAVVASIAPAAEPKKAPAKKAGAPKKQGSYKPRKPKAPKAPKA